MSVTVLENTDLQKNICKSSVSFSFLADKKTLIDPKVIHLDDNSETEDYLDYIPPSPSPDEISCNKSSLETR